MNDTEIIDRFVKQYGISIEELIEYVVNKSGGSILNLPGKSIAEISISTLATDIDIIDGVEYPVGNLFTSNIKIENSTENSQKFIISEDYSHVSKVVEG